MNGDVWSPPVLGEVVEVPVTELWPLEEVHFTPWLLEHASYLEEVLGIPIELHEAEHPVGKFELDLYGRDLSTGSTLIVENQLTKTDHKHLGQLLAYAAGTDATTIVWISPHVREEHRQTLDWLNQHTDEQTRFFGIEIHAIRIGDSAPALQLRLAAEPNDWQKTVKQTVAASAAGGTKAELYQQYWTTYLAELQASHPEWSNAKVPPRENWWSQPSPVWPLYFLVSFAAGGRLRHELYIDNRDGEIVEWYFQHLLAHRALIEQTYGRPLSFEELPTKRASRIADYLDGCDVTEVDRHGEFVVWHIDAGERLRAALAVVPPIEAPDPGED